MQPLSREKREEMTNKLPKIVKGRPKRIGRGIGSGKGGHTVGRGQKGQKTRDNISILFEGVKVKKSLIKRLPLRRGKEKFAPSGKPIIVKLSLLNIFNTGEEVSLESLIKKNIVREKDVREVGVKVLGDGELKKKLIISVSISKSAAKKVEKAGGKIK